jgi:hypothetical protein
MHFLLFSRLINRIAGHPAKRIEELLPWSIRR